MAIPRIHPDKDCTGLFVNRAYYDSSWNLTFEFPMPRVDLAWEFTYNPKMLSHFEQDDAQALNVWAAEYLTALKAGGLCTPTISGGWNQIMAEVQGWGALIRQILHNYHRTEEQAHKIVSDCSKKAWRILMLEELHERKRILERQEKENNLKAEQKTIANPIAPLRAENQRDLIAQLEDVRSTFFYTTPEQIDKEVDRLDATKRGLTHAIYNVAGVVMSPTEVMLLTSAATTLATKISGLMQVRKRMMEQAKDKQSGPLDTSL